VRERKLHADGITSAVELEEAEALHRAVYQRARTLGFSEDDIDRMGERPDEPVYLEVRAPFAGEIIERSAVRGERVEEGKSLFLLADRAAMWAMLSIPEAELSGVRVGQTVELDVDALPGRSFVGELTWIAARVDDRTRMALARAELANPDGLLRDRMFARARIVTREAAEALLVPSGAVQEVEGRSLVFVKLADDLFEARAVYLGAEAGGRREVLLGLASNDEIAVERSFALRSQLLVSRLGAGCVDD
jgi:cobalt-zinc-cadmium efflux system membrane fusion protein